MKEDQPQYITRTESDVDRSTSWVLYDGYEWDSDEATYSEQYMHKKASALR